MQCHGMMELPTLRNTRSIRVTSRRPLQGRSRRQNNNPVILNDDDAEPQNVSCIDLTDLDADFIDLTSPAPNDASIIILPGTESTEPRARPRTSRRGSRTRRQSDRVNLDDSENDVIEISESYQALPLPLSFEDAGNESFNANDSLRSPRQEISCPICMDNKKQIQRSGRQLISTVCGHVFCEPCIKASITTQRCCPTCRKKLTQRQIHPLYI